MPQIPHCCCFFGPQRVDCAGSYPTSPGEVRFGPSGAVEEKSSTGTKDALAPIRTGNRTPQVVPFAPLDPRVCPGPWGGWQGFPRICHGSECVSGRSAGGGTSLLAPCSSGLAGGPDSALPGPSASPQVLAGAASPYPAGDPCRRLLPDGSQVPAPAGRRFSQWNHPPTEGCFPGVKTFSLTRSLP